MWTQITVAEAVTILIAGGKVDDGFIRWGGTIQLRCPAHWRKARRRKELAHKLSHSWNLGDGLWVYRT